MLTKFTIFAKKHYDDAFRLIEQISTQLNADDQFAREAFLMSFDLTLQFCFFQLSQLDDQVDVGQVNLLCKMANSTNLLEYLKITNPSALKSTPNQPNTQNSQNQQNFTNQQNVHNPQNQPNFQNQPNTQNFLIQTINIDKTQIHLSKIFHLFSTCMTQATPTQKTQLKTTLTHCLCSLLNVDQPTQPDIHLIYQTQIFLF